MKVDQRLLLDAFTHLVDLKRQVEAQVTGFNHVVLDLMNAKIALQMVISDLDTLEVQHED